MRNYRPGKGFKEQRIKSSREGLILPRVWPLRRPPGTFRYSSGQERPEVMGEEQIITGFRFRR